MNLTIAQLLAIMPEAKGMGAIYLPFINSSAVEFGISINARRFAPFLANLAHETGDLQHIVENLNYSADGLANTWRNRYSAKDEDGQYLMVKGRYVPNDLAKKIAKNPEAIANNTYANREGNGDVDSGDGWRFRGSGGFQLTFRNNHTRCAKHFGMAVEQFADWVRTPEGAMRSAAWFYWQAGCSKPADAGDFDGVSDLINIGKKTAKAGDAIGWKDRLANMNVAVKVLSAPALAA